MARLILYTSAGRSQDCIHRAFSSVSGAGCNPMEDETGASCIFFLTFISNNLIYESHCDFFLIAKFDVRENQSMKSATKKAAPKKKAPAKKKK
jgi:hypothetical protein